MVVEDDLADKKRQLAEKRVVFKTDFENVYNY